MAKVLGKLMALTFGGTAVPLSSQNYDENYDVIDVTDNLTTGDTKESITSRATRTLQISRILRNGSSAKQIGTASKLTFNSVDYNVTSINYDVSYDEVDVTDTATAAGAKELLTAFAERKTSMDLWMKDSTADPVIGTAQTSTLFFATGITAAGSFMPQSKKVQGEVKGAQKVTVDGAWQGAVTETLLGNTMVTLSAVVMTFKTGSTPRGLSGNAIITKKSITSDVNGEIKITETLVFSGAVTETLYAA